MNELLAAIAAARSSPRRTIRPAIVAVAAVLLLGAAGVVMLRPHGAARPPPLDAIAAGFRPAVGVMPPGAAAFGPEEPSTALAESLRAALAAGGGVRVLPQDELVRAAADAAIEPGAAPSPAALAALRAHHAVDYVVELGGGAEADGLVVLRASVVRTATGETAATAEGRGKSANELAWRAGYDLRRALGLPAATDADVAAARAALPSKDDARRAYAEGLDALRALDAVRAREALQRAASSEPDAPAVHAALAQSLDWLGYDTLAVTEAQRARDAAAKLAQEDRLAIDALRASVDHDATAAAAAYKALAALFPDRVDYGVRLVEAQRRRQEYESAEAALASLRRLPSPLAGDPRVDLAESALAIVAGDARRASASADRARAELEAGGARSSLVRARVQHALASLRLGDRAAAEKELEESARRAADLGEVDERAFAQELLAAALVDDGRFDEARGMLQRGLEDMQTRGREGRVVELLEAIALLERRRGDDGEARRRYEDALAHEQRRGGHARSVATTRMLVGDLLDEMGEPSSARTQYETALALRREARSGTGEAEALVQLASIALAQRDVKQARELAEAALARATAAKARPREAQARAVLAEILADQGDASAKEAFAVACDGSSGDGPRAESLCRARYARALVALHGAPADALAQIERAVALATAADAWAARWEVRTTAARVRAALDAGARAEARARLAEIVDEATRANASRPALEATVALGEVELAQGAAEGRRRLARAAQDASGRGLEGLAFRARALATR